MNDALTTLRRQSACERALRFMADREWHTSLDIVNAAGIAAARRLWEAERAGVRIDKEKVGADRWQWRLADTRDVSELVEMVERDMASRGKRKRSREVKQGVLM